MRARATSPQRRCAVPQSTPRHRVSAVEKPAGRRARAAARATQAIAVQPTPSRQALNPKPETRNPKETRDPKPEVQGILPGRELLAVGLVRISDFGLPSVFGFRASDFRHALPPDYPLLRRHSSFSWRVRLLRAATLCLRALYLLCRLRICCSIFLATMSMAA